jgi:beta-phosphoglucomutase
MVSQPKPSPQIFFKAADQLNAQPEKCIVFEDSTSGLKAGNNAGMKVVGITTSHPAAVISQVASLVINDYADVNLHKLAALFEQ